LNSKRPYILLGLVLLALLVPFFTSAQTLQLKQTLSINKPGRVSADRLDNIYFSDQKNNIYQVSPVGKLLRTYSPPTQAHVALLEAWNMVRIFVFYDDRQQITLLDRFLTPLSSTRLSDLTEGNIRLATLALDEQIWLLNESDFTLAKVDVQHPESIMRTQLNQILPKTQTDFRFMREYQNNLYLIDRTSGIYIFDNLGNYKKKIPVTGLTYLGFKGDEGYYLKNNQLIFFNLYTQQERSLTLPLNANYYQALMGNNLIYLFSDSTLDIYSIAN